jgi:hypothetical protein
MVGREKLVYVLNPDGLTESIFVARGEANEGQYRGKRFTKAGAKAEKRRVQEEALRQAELLKPQSDSVEELVMAEGDGLSFADYNNENEQFAKNIVSVKIHGSAMGWIGLFDSKADMIFYTEFKGGFRNKQDINEAIEVMNVSNFSLLFYKNAEGAIVFKGEGDMILPSEA